MKAKTKTDSRIPEATPAKQIPRNHLKKDAAFELLRVGLRAGGVFRLV